ncbi:MAG: Unknown protein, partial [uncultured Sulfurovum sp.]
LFPLQILVKKTLVINIIYELNK